MKRARAPRSTAGQTEPFTRLLTKVRHGNHDDHKEHKGQEDHAARDSVARERGEVQPELVADEPQVTGVTMVLVWPVGEFAAEAHERELHRELARLDRRFEEWRNGQLGSGALSIEVHEYETGPSRELFKRYNSDLPDMMVAYAIAAGILEREEMPAELLEALTRPLEYYDRLKERGELKIPKE